MNTNDAEGKDAKGIIGELGWPCDVPVERLVASLFDRAMRAGVIEGEVILGYTFDRGELPGWAGREDRLLVAAYALCRFASDQNLLEKLRFDGALVSHEVLQSDEWTAASPRLPGMCGLYETARDEWNRAKADEQVG